MASEMLYPVVPIYLKEIGFSIFLIGLLEGIAEFTAGLSKGYFGKKSDEQGLRLPFVRMGYFLSAISKPMMAVLKWPLWLFSARAIDRLGKGVRTAARDALLSQNATTQTKARVFALHRGMDTLGAVSGPIIALIFLYYFPKDYISLFYIAFIPGLVAVLLTFLLKEKQQPTSTMKKGNFFSFLAYWRIAPSEYKKLVTGLLIFTLFNSSDVFLLLKTREITGDDTLTIAAYIFYNLVYAICAYPIGVIADRYGLKTVFSCGLLLFATVYFLFAFTQTTTGVFIAFFIYGLYAAATEGISKAWITNISHNANTGTAIGFYTSGQSIATLLASSSTGLLWTIAGSGLPFMLTGLTSLGIFIYFRAIKLKS